MECDDVLELLALHAGGDTGNKEREAVETHVALCAACARELDLFRESRSVLASLRSLEAPSGTWRSMSAAVRAETFPRRPGRAPAVIDAILRGAAVVMVGVALGVVVHRMGRPSPAAAPGVAASGGVSSPDVVLPANPAGAGILPSFRPRATPQLRPYLPRVESIPAGGEKDF